MQSGGSPVRAPLGRHALRRLPPFSTNPFLQEYSMKSPIPTAEPLDNCCEFLGVSGA